MADPATIAKIKKLIALAENNTNPHEAAAAAEMAAALAAKHNIDMDAARSHGDKVFVEEMIEGFTFLKRDDMAAMSLVHWTARLFGCTVYYRTYQSNRKVVVNGQDHNVALTHSWIKYLWESCVRANTKHAYEMKRPTFKDREIARQTFRLSFCQTVANRLREKVEAMKREGVSGSTALVVANWFETEQREVAEWVKNQHPEMGSVSSRAPTKIEAAAYTAGDRAGRTINLSDQIGSSTPRRAEIG